MPPTPAPEEEEINNVRKIMKVNSFTDVETAVNSLNNSQWAEALDYLDAWDAVKDDYTEIKNGLLGANISPEKQRLDIINDLRTLLGYPRINMSGISFEDDYSHSIAVQTVF